MQDSKTNDLQASMDQVIAQMAAMTRNQATQRKEDEDKEQYHVPARPLLSPQPHRTSLLDVSVFDPISSSVSAASGRKNDFEQDKETSETQGADGSGHFPRGGTVAEDSSKLTRRVWLIPPT